MVRFRVVALSLSFAWMAGCESIEPRPTSSTSQPGVALTPEQHSRRIKSFEQWQKSSREGIVEGDIVWDCAWCPRMRARLPGGIWAGSADWDVDRQPNEPDLTSLDTMEFHAVAIHEVTRGEFRAFVAATNRAVEGGCHTDRLDPTANFLNPGFEQSDDHPVVCVSWKDANDYLAWLNSQTSGGYRLPTETEWHAAAFGGGYEIYLWGEQPEPACLYSNVLDASGATQYPADGSLKCDDGATNTSPVGRYMPSVMQRYDVIGNAAEWTSTCGVTASAGSKCEQAVVRGGSWKSTRIHLRRAARQFVPVDERDHSIGFRVAKTMPAPDQPLKSATDYLIRGRQWMQLLDDDRARQDLERAVALDPKDSHVVSARGWARFRQGEVGGAREDFTAALSTNPANAEAIAGLGACELASRNLREAVRRLDDALALAPTYQTARAIRATANTHAGNLDQALADAAEVLLERPTDIELLQLRVRLRWLRHEWSEAAVELEKLTESLPTLNSAQEFAARWYSALMMDEQATAAATRALRASPTTIDSYLLRADVRPWMDIDGRRSDIEFALGLEPQSPAALRALGEMESRLGNHAAASRAFTAILDMRTFTEGRAGIFIARGIEQLKLGDRAAAFRDFDQALGPKPRAPTLNDLCWYLMAADVALDRAMAYCDKAIQTGPRHPASLDSKATLMLRLGRWNEAISLYDEALALAPDLANSLYGRGIAKQSRCRCEEGSADLESALKLQPSIGRSFERLGFTAPFPGSPSN